MKHESLGAVRERERERELYFSEYKYSVIQHSNKQIELKNKEINKGALCLNVDRHKK